MSEKSKTIEDKMNELRAMVAWFENDDFAIEQAGAKFEAAAKLAKDIEKDLSEMKSTVNVLKKSFEES
ncbi:MAG TPA: exodeoxyribonuclease VII small subunit [Candidatus Saccharibacteria bacterium]|nr:exodeoxyribonuclease VII small subunit [Candidatus Saccharibacteria bacterium]HRK94372.1 exodeoxyribonuclease VII small subunit [Candidatus Saccharibacteria bacterium]